MLKLNKVSKKFLIESTEARVALDHVSLSVKKGELVSVIGSNGAGKSTLLRAICGEIPIDSGFIHLAGADVTLTLLHERVGTIGRVFQDPLHGTVSEFSIEENLAIAQMR